MGLILASASPRRSELLRKARIVFRVEPAHIEEVRSSGEAPDAYVRRLARDKARAIALKHPNDFVLGADTTVVCNGEVLEKPVDEEDARRMLLFLSHRTHEVYTGICLAGPGTEEVQSDVTRVTVTRIREKEIQDYIATGEPMDKAGAYGIQGVFSRWIERIDGDYTTIVGLPVARVYAMLQRAKLM